MAATKSVLGFGSALQLGDGGSPENYTTILELHDIPELGSTVPLVKATHQQSPGVQEEYITGIKDGSEVAFVGGWLPTDATQNSTTGIRAQHINGTRANYKAVWPTVISETHAFPALCTKFGVIGPMANLLEMHFTLKIVGPIAATH